MNLMNSKMFKIIHLHTKAAEFSQKFFINVMKKTLTIIISAVILFSFVCATKDNDINGSMTSDKQTVYFSAKKKKTLGGYDIYKSDRMSNGSWSEAQNLGGQINSEYDEINPKIDSDDVTLYFDVVMNGDTVKMFSTLSDEGFWWHKERVDK